jgi:hypothetical protein
MRGVGLAALVVGVLAVAGAVVAAGMGMAAHHFADVKTWFAIALGAAVVGAALVIFGRRALRRSN